jgi:hypothetical protein
MEDWHRMEVFQFPPNEIPELENHNENLAINGSIPIIEDGYEQTTI